MDKSTLLVTLVNVVTYGHMNNACTNDCYRAATVQR